MGLLDLVMPQGCAGCGRGDGVLCEGCAGLLGGPARPVWPAPAPPGLPPPWAAAAYEGPVRAVINAYKEAGRTSLARPLGAAVARAVLAARTGAVPAVARGGRVSRAGAGPVALVAVPTARAAVRRRGHDPARRIAGAAVRALRGAGVPAVRVDGLRQVRRLADQSGLGAAGRAANLAEALAATGPVPRGWDVVVIDDVITTGATLAEAARALRAAGAAVAAAATVAATPRRG